MYVNIVNLVVKALLRCFVMRCYSNSGNPCPRCGKTNQMQVEEKILTKVCNSYKKLK